MATSDYKTYDGEPFIPRELAIARISKFCGECGNPWWPGDMIRYVTLRDHWSMLHEKCAEDHPQAQHNPNAAGGAGPMWDPVDGQIEEPVQLALDDMPERPAGARVLGTEAELVVAVIQHLVAGVDHDRTQRRHQRFTWAIRGDDGLPLFRSGTEAEFVTAVKTGNVAGLDYSRSRPRHQRFSWTLR